MAPRHRFVVDINVGRLAKWLRVMGYDTLFPRGSNDNDLVRLALREERVLVTRDRGIGLRRAVRQGQMQVVQIVHDDFRRQLRQLVRALDLDLEGGFTRCVRCNDPLNPVPREDVENRLPPYVFRHHRQFMECPRCLRIYWRGTHWTNMSAELDGVYQEAG